MRRETLLTLAIGFLLSAELALAQHDHHQLGEVDFPISCNEQAHEQFELGVAQLHHMMYEQARPHFEAAAEADPQCAYLGVRTEGPVTLPVDDAQSAEVTARCGIGR